ncbi:hypothetical protein BD626DRAFT_473416 [Schizophyllum amplum]|uniref:Very-long-chain 3-oxoacyl-CoA reductase n=1 Tax=Schizophyllum amplum TaxID=97359 RepID=A0A550CWR7_9AGAR|nr:hypothetical protein BD626DRAFT_473416 [Auriculariopsis ampla]
MDAVKSLYAGLSRDCPLAAVALVALGSLSLLKFCWKTTCFLLQTFILSGTSLKKFGAKQGAWAVVTGATDGIGKEFALQLAKAGFNVFLVSRTPATLAAVGAEIEQKYPGVKTAFHAIDFAKADENAYGKLAAALSAQEVSVLVNNVGKSHNMPAYLVDVPMEETMDIVQINVNATLRVTYAVLPGMVQKKRGLILNIGSFAGAVPSPMLAPYSGTKAFLSTFSDALGAEVKKDGITVEHVNTYFVVSKLSKIRKPSLFIPTPTPFVRSVLSKIGLACGAAYSGRPNTSTPYWSHALMDYGMTLIGVKSLFIEHTHRLHVDIRKRALRKMERDAKKQ